MKIVHLQLDDPVKLIDWPPGIDNRQPPWDRIKLGMAGVVEGALSRDLVAVMFPGIVGFFAIPSGCLAPIA